MNDFSHMSCKELENALEKAKSRFNNFHRKEHRASLEANKLKEKYDALIRSAYVYGKEASLAKGKIDILEKELKKRNKTL